MSRLTLVCALACLWPATHASAGKVAPRKTGTITGHIAFKGTVPKPVPIPKNDPFCAKLKIADERVVATDGKLRDVHVSLPSGTAGTHAPVAPTVTVDQSGCMYRPRVVGVMDGQKVVVKNSDMTFHNVRGTHGKHHVFNHGHPQKFPPITESAGKAGQTLTLRCDIHPWMRGYAVVTDHPFFDVSAGDGSFTIANVPAGTHEVQAWHPELGLKKARVKVKAGKTARVVFTFE